jgi:hydrogenase maturation protease
MTRPDGPILVLGIGNVLLRDEGVGVHVVRAIEGLVDCGELELPPGTTLIDGGTLGLELLPLISDARAVLLVDAIDAGRAPGAVEVIRGDTLREVQPRHDRAQRVGVGDLSAAAWLIGALPETVALVGIQPSEIAVGLELTEVVRAAMPAAVATTLAELRRLHAIAPTSSPGSVGRGYDAKGSAA